MRFDPQDYQGVATASLNWRRWGLGVELTFGDPDMEPRTWGLYVILGPLWLGVGIEEGND